MHKIIVLLSLFTSTVFATGTEHLCQPSDSRIGGTLFLKKYYEGVEKKTVAQGSHHFYFSVDRVLERNERYNCPKVKSFLDFVSDLKPFMSKHSSLCLKTCETQAISEHSNTYFNKEEKIKLLQKECRDICFKTIKENHLVMKGIIMSQKFFK